MIVKNYDFKKAYDGFKDIIITANKSSNFIEHMRNNRTEAIIKTPKGDITKNLRIQHVYFNKIVELLIPDSIIDYIPLYGGDFAKGSIIKYINSVSKVLDKEMHRTNIEEALQKLDNASAVYKKYHPEIVGETKSLYEAYCILRDKHDVYIDNKTLHNHILQNLQIAFSVYSHIIDLNTTVVFNGIFMIEELCRLDETCNEIIKHGRFKPEMNIFEILEQRNTDGAYVQNKIVEHNIEPLCSMIKAQTGIRYEQLLDSVVGLGIKPFDNSGDDTNRDNRLRGSYIYPHLLSSSYLRGLKTKPELYLSVANSISALILSKLKMSDAGYISKLLKLIAKPSKVHRDRDHECDTKYRRDIYVRDIEMLKRMEGMYYTDENWVDHKIDISKPELYIGKHLKLRIAAFCNNIQYGGICRKCLGDLLYDENRTMWMSGYQANIGLIFAAYISGPAQQSILSAKHNQIANPLMPSYWIVKDDSLYPLPDNIKIKYQYIDHVYFEIDGVDIIPDEVRIIEPKQLLMPWSNKTAQFNRLIEITVDKTVYRIMSDTLFYIEDNVKKEHHVVKLKHMFENIGVGHLFNSLDNLRRKSDYKNNETNEFFDYVDNIKIDLHLNFMYVIVANMIRDENGEVPDFGIKNQSFKILSIIEALKNSPFVNTLPIGYATHIIKNIENFSIENRYHIDTDNTLRK